MSANERPWAGGRVFGINVPAIPDHDPLADALSRADPSADWTNSPDAYYRRYAAHIRAALDAAGYIIVSKVALTSEDEIAHGEAVTQHANGTYERLGQCAYCNDIWPCRTQRGINRLLAIIEDDDVLEEPEVPSGGPD
jgi:hypothetical protein